METTREGSNLFGLCSAAESIGLKTLGAKVSFIKLEKEVPLPCVVFWQQRHYVVVYKIRKGTVYISDPAIGLVSYSKEQFLKEWIGQKASEIDEEGIVVLFEPTYKFEESDNNEEENKAGFGFLHKYISLYKNFVAQLLLGLLIGSLLQLIFPFLTQSIVDIGIANQDIHFIYVVLFAQLFFFLGKTTVEIIRAWILLHLSTRINISLISDFFIKLMHLPISFFDVKLKGDLMQRIDDHYRIENLLTSSSLSVLFSLFNLVIFGFVLVLYNTTIFSLFLAGTCFYLLWVFAFMNKRKRLDYRRFSEQSAERDKVIELIDGMQEIKLHNAERRMRWSWEYLQARLFRTDTKTLALGQTQMVGSSFINELKNIFITFYAAKLVISGDFTLGMMLAVSYIIGQLNGPVSQLVSFLHSAQDAKISLERLKEIHNKEEEEKDTEEKTAEIAAGVGIVVSNISFRYKGALNKVLHNLSLSIPPNKITAIVGASGSGKTTLMKILLKFYDVDEGVIRLGHHDLKNISYKAWRDSFGVVMQEGYIFNDTIARNIAVGQDTVDKERLARAVKIANLSEFIDELPLGFNTKVGEAGIGISTGQKQRLLIARAIYKDPKFIFFDEATSALDAGNERVIMSNLNAFLENRTAVIIAHRLSTVKNADQIVVLREGKIAERGDHKSLIKKRGLYFHLVKNQLALENLEKVVEPGGGQNLVNT